MRLDEDRNNPPVQNFLLGRKVMEKLETSILNFHGIYSIAIKKADGLELTHGSGIHHSEEIFDIEQE